MNYHLIHHPEFSRDMDRLFEEWKKDQNSSGGREFQAAMGALRALREEREAEYEGKQLGYGPRSYDLRDCAELKVPVEREFTPGGYERGPSHRLVYREFEALPKVEGDRVVQDPNAQPYRQPIAFAHRSMDPADLAGQRLGRTVGMPSRDLHGLVGGGRPATGKDLRDLKTTPHRIPVPADLLKQAQILRDSPPAGTKPKPATAPQANVNRPSAPGPSKSKDR
ncbi:hypothetical protein [Kribbella sindirgiensis]|uniref:Uncharacterized protein n=1 Tax=Kribbella sindirgiensis TaxID=1124744 RepID=A0A4R0IL78_9ACTN|nr:hypothetical protein [Kribbella sindirgiensis]TCC33537.1 hypothetical protein E0H50_16345 [Kribbella sindirgiensis]